MKFGLSKEVVSQEVGGVMGVAKNIILSAQMTVHVQYTDNYSINSMHGNASS